MTAKRQFEGDYVRNGLYLTRNDLVEALAMIRVEYPGQLKGILFQSAQLSARLRSDKAEDNRRRIYGQKNR